MDPSYETVVAPQTVVWTLSAMGLHGLMLALQLGLAFFLIAMALNAWLAPGREGPWLSRVGLVAAGRPLSRAAAATRLALGVALLLPLALRAPFLVSLVAICTTLAVLILQERRLPSVCLRPGLWARHLAIAVAALLATFGLWEREDPLALGVELLATAQGWRTHELEWQLRNDRNAPKVGDLAPDFELQDPDGEVAVRLSAFRGRRPVALAFGSYT